MNELEHKIYRKLSEDAVSRGLYSLQDVEDVEIEPEYKNENFKFPDYEEIAAKEVFNSMLGFLEEKAGVDIITEHKFGRLKNGNKFFLTMVFDTNEHALMFLENEKKESSRLFPNVEHKFLEDKTLIAIYGIQ
jgi:hypothetical protein